MSKYLVLVVLLFPIVSHAEKLPKVPPHNVGGIADAKDAGTISGVVWFNGEKPPVQPIAEISGNGFCDEHHKDKLPQRRTFMFGKNDGRDTVQNVLVYVSKGLEDRSFDPPKTPVVLDQVKCLYTPHVVAVMVGQTLEVRNSDDTLHNVMAAPRVNPAFNFGQPSAGSKNELVFKGAEMKMNVKCFMHPWMSGYIHVLEHPYFAVTGEDGSFTIKGLPPGEYEVTVLHEASLLEPTPPTATVTVATDEEKKDVNFTYQVKAEE